MIKNHALSLHSSFITSHILITANYNFMKAIKKYLGIVWLLLGPASLYYLILTASQEITKKPVIDTKIQWGIFIGVFLPIAIGLMVFGWYALQGEYDVIEESNT